MISNENIIFFSSDDWSSGLKTSKYHIAVRLARYNRVLFVNSIGLRNPTMNTRDIKRIVDKLKGFCKGLKKVTSNLYIYTPVVLPFHKFKFVRKFNSSLLILHLKIVTSLLNFKKPILLIFMPTLSDVIGKFKEKGAVYYCIDELKGYREVDSTMIEQMERNLLSKVNCVIACSQKLTERKKLFNPYTYYIPHGVDWCLFRKTLDNNLEIPRDISSIRKPIIGYYGFISDDWIDFDLLNYVAFKRPEWSIVLIGKAQSDLSTKIRAKNIYFLGVKNFVDLPKYSKAFDIAVVPFKINELTMSSNPLKLFEYLSSGRPVVSVNIPEVTKYRNLVKIADNYDDFFKNIEKVLIEDNEEQQLKRSDYMKKETWENRLEKISEIIVKHCSGVNP